MLKSINKTIWRRIALIALLLPVCIFFPFALWAVGFLAWTIYDDLKSPIIASPPPPRSWRDAKAEDDDWLTLFLEGCESPAEEAFLRAMVTEFDLQPDKGLLKAPELTLEMQVAVASYRYDFVANGRQVIEIDGASYHSSPDQVERDRIRDEHTVHAGYSVLRIPATVVFKTPREAIRLVRSTLVKTPTYTRPVPSGPKEPQKSVASYFKSFVDGLDEIDRQSQISILLSNFDARISDERRFFEAATKQYDWDRRDEARVGTSNIYLDSLYRPNADHLRYVWSPIPPSVTAISSDIQTDVDKRISATLSSHADTISKIGSRCASDHDYAKHLCRILADAGYPEIEAVKIVPRTAFDYVPFMDALIARIRRQQQTTAEKP